MSERFGNTQQDLTQFNSVLLLSLLWHWSPIGYGVDSVRAGGVESRKNFSKKSIDKFQNLCYTKYVRLRGKQTLHLARHDSLCLGGIVINSEPPICGCDGMADIGDLRYLCKGSTRGPLVVCGRWPFNSVIPHQKSPALRAYGFESHHPHHPFTVVRLNGRRRLVNSIVAIRS